MNKQACNGNTWKSVASGSQYSRCHLGLAVTLT